MSNGLTRLRDAVPRRRRSSVDGAARASGSRSIRRGARGGPRHLRARRARLGRRGAAGDRRRAAFSPDALTGMEANLRFAGPETMETKIFGRLTAWQNWIFQRPNAVGEKGALTAYGSQSQAGVRLQQNVTHCGHDADADIELHLSMLTLHRMRSYRHDLSRTDPQQRRPLEQQAAAARARALAAEVHPVVARHGAAGVPGLPPGLRAHGGQRRSRRAGRTSST